MWCACSTVEKVMRLSIFSFKPIKQTICLMAGMILVFGGIKVWVLEHAPKGLRPLPGSFWMNKTHTRERFDIVLIGDSRLYRGVAPSVMRSVFPNMKILNFGYSSAGMSGQLLESGEEKLDSGGQKIIVLGLTPYSLTASAALNEHFKGFKRAIYWPFKIPFLTTIVAPHETVWVITYLLGSKISDYFQIPHPDGWIESDRPSVNFDEALKEYKHKFSKERISVEVQNEMLEQVRVWGRKGIKVFGFRPPASKSMEDLEDKLSGYDEARIKDLFLDSGGLWIDFPDRYFYETYDGSHLKAQSAQKLSLALAQYISEVLSPEGKGEF